MYVHKQRLYLSIHLKGEFIAIITIGISKLTTAGKMSHKLFNISWSWTSIAHRVKQGDHIYPLVNKQTC